MDRGKEVTRPRKLYIRPEHPNVYKKVQLNNVEAVDSELWMKNTTTDSSSKGESKKSKGQVVGNVLRGRSEKDPNVIATSSSNRE